MKFLAKSNPEETIQKHTNNLLFQLKKLKNIYNQIPINWDLLECACLYHDLGKINEIFQNKLKYNKRYSKEIPHALLSLLFIDPDELSEKFSDEEIQILYQAVAYHHERDYADYSNEIIENQYESLKKQLKKFKYEKIPNLHLVDYIDDYYFQLGDRTYKENSNFKKYVLIKGLLNKLDYAASAHIDVELKNDFIIENLEKIGYQWNELQKFMIKNREKNVIAIAQTGMGKTEAGLLWIGNNKGFYTLPLKIAINAIYDRIIEKILKKEHIEKVGILHSDTYSEYLKREEILEELDLNYYYTTTKQMSLALTITTLDQILDIVYFYRGFEAKLATLSYSKIVFDEVQMYSADLLSYLLLGIKLITEFGGKFSILTATLPTFLIDFMKEMKIDFIMSEKPFINDKIRHSIKVIDEEINGDFIYSIYKENSENRILIICNTVKKSQEIYNNLKDYGINKINLLHSKFIRKDRLQKEKEIIETGNDYDSNGIWISTQIVEASLDVDFDILITELSDLNSFFQRLGRVYRRRDWEKKDYNTYLFIGGEKNKISGLKSFIDKDIFKLSKEKIKNIDGILTEKDKIELINSTYTVENLKDTEYYKTLEKMLDYVKSFNPYEAEKKDINKIFRNIENVLVIPEPVYLENKNIIETLISKYNDINLTKKEKYNIKIKIMEYTSSIWFRELKKTDELKLNKYEKIYIHKCEYSSEVGIYYEKSEEIDDENQFF